MNSTALGYTVTDIAIAASVAGFCWAFFGMAAVAVWNAIGSLFRRGGR